MKNIKYLLIPFLFTACFKSEDKTVEIKTGESKTSIYEQKLNSLDGEPMDLKKYKGSAVMFVNIATKCGYTPQLEGLEALQKKYKDKSFKIVGIPSNDFGGQTPENSKGIKEFCKLNYGVSFELSEKTAVKNPDSKSLVAWLVKESKTKEPVKWNFEKFVVNKDGDLIDRFGSSVTPEDSVISKAIEQAL